MSYILEALADSEQARLQIAAAPRYSLLPTVGEEVPRSRVWPYLLAGALLANAAVLQFWLRPAAPAGVAPAPTVPQTTGAAAAAPRVSAPGGSEAPAKNVREPAPRELGLSPSPSFPSPPPRAVSAPATANPGTAAASTVGDGATIALQKLAPKVTVKRKAEGAVLAKAATVAASAGMPAAAVAAAAVPVPAAPASTPGGDLPPALRQELPALAVAGFIRDEGSSMVIVNDRLVREGDEVAPGVKLEKIVGDSLLFNYKGYRFKR